MVSNSILRKNAREQLGSSIFNGVWLTVLLMCLIQSVIMAAASSFFILSFLVVGILEYGMVNVYLKRIRTAQPIEFNDMFKGFTDGIGENIILGFMIQIFIFLWTLLFIIPGFVKSYSYSMAFYIRYDNPGKSWNDCITESREMMDGYKMQLFLLDLSFIGWALLCVLTCGIGVLFLAPYISMSRANFYEALKASKTPYVPPVDNDAQTV